MDLRESVQIVPGADSALIAYARALTYWHRRHRFCGTCGARAEPREAGHQRRCSDAACGAVHFPRTDTAVITLVHDGDECLLCRQSRWPPGMHSTLAGFLEPGESLEECVAREIGEESGVAVGDVRYHSSQPWPFPGTIMVGFMAQARSREIAVDETELEHAHWYQAERPDRPPRQRRIPSARPLLDLAAPDRGLARRPHPALAPSRASGHRLAGRIPPQSRMRTGPRSGPAGATAPARRQARSQASGASARRLREKKGVSLARATRLTAAGATPIQPAAPASACHGAASGGGA